MSILLVNGNVLDEGLSSLTRIFEIFDPHIDDLNRQIQRSHEPDTDGLLDSIEFMIGSGLVAVQRYQTEVITQLFPDKKPYALSLGPNLNDEVTYAQALNAITNYWKHGDEWLGKLFKGKQLTGKPLDNFETISQFSSLMRYPCTDVLYAMVRDSKLQLASLIPYLEAWRDELLEKTE